MVCPFNVCGASIACWMVGYVSPVLRFLTGNIPVHADTPEIEPLSQGWIVTGPVTGLPVPVGLAGPLGPLAAPHPLQVPSSGGGEEPLITPMPYWASFTMS